VLHPNPPPPKSKRALLLRAGSLAASMEISEARTIGPSLGSESIQQGCHARTGRFAGLVAGQTSLKAPQTSLNGLMG
jgi:hypothetical protein